MKPTLPDVPSVPDAQPVVPKCSDCGMPVTSGHGRPFRPGQTQHDYYGECINAMRRRIDALDEMLENLQRRTKGRGND